MQRLLLASLLAAALATSAPAAAQEDATRSQVEALLGGIEYVPSAQQWQALGPQGEATLRQIAADPATPRSRRGRALSALAHFPSPETRLLFERLLADEQQPVLLRRKALVAAANAFGPQALPTLQPYLQHPDQRLRESAALAISAIHTPEARALLQERLLVEDAPWLREALHNALEARP
jgi:HEAT repeat protein